MHRNRNIVIGIIVAVLALVVVFWAGREYEEEESVGENIEETVDRAGDEIEEGLEETGDNIEGALDEE